MIRVCSLDIAIRTERRRDIRGERRVLFSIHGSRHGLRPVQTLVLLLTSSSCATGKDIGRGELAGISSSVVGHFREHVILRR